jgi:hypothetical protein
MDRGAMGPVCLRQSRFIMSGATPKAKTTITVLGLICVLCFAHNTRSQNKRDQVPPSNKLAPNQRPSVTLNRPEQFALLVGPADITLEATALDPDGTISKVEFFDYDKSLGLGTSVDGKNFVLTVRGLKYGDHAFVAVATDNGGRTNWSGYKSVFINGLAVVAIKSPGRIRWSHLVQSSCSRLS